MASVLHGSARTTPGIRAELQASKDSAVPCSALRPEPQDCAEVAPADHGGRFDGRDRARLPASLRRLLTSPAFPRFESH